MSFQSIFCLFVFLLNFLTLAAFPIISVQSLYHCLGNYHLSKTHNLFATLPFMDWPLYSSTQTSKLLNHNLIMLKGRNKRQPTSMQKHLKYVFNVTDNAKQTNKQRKPCNFHQLWQQNQTALSGDFQIRAKHCIAIKNGQPSLVLWQLKLHVGISASSIS